MSASKPVHGQLKFFLGSNPKFTFTSPDQSITVNGPYTSNPPLEQAITVHATAKLPQAGPYTFTGTWDDSGLKLKLTLPGTNIVGQISSFTPYSGDTTNIDGHAVVDVRTDRNLADL